MSGSLALKTNDMWSKTIGHDPYQSNAEVADRNDKAAMVEQSESLMLLAKISKLSGTEVRGGCKKCGALGHLSFQCRNEPKIEIPSDDSSDSGSSSEGEESSDSEKNVIQKVEVPKFRQESMNIKRKHRDDEDRHDDERDSSSTHKKSKTEKKHKKEKKEKKTKKEKHKHKSRKESSKRKSKDSRG